MSEQFVQAGCGCSGAGQRTQLTYEYIDFEPVGEIDPTHDHTTVIREAKWNGTAYVPVIAEYYDIVLLTVPYSDGTADGTWSSFSWDQPYIATIARAELDSFGEPVTGRIWAQHMTRDADRRLDRVYFPSAISEYKPGVADPLQSPLSFRTDAGLVLEYTYSDLGIWMNPIGFPESVYMREGDSGPGSLIYTVTCNDSQYPWRPHKVESNQVEGGYGIPSDALLRETVEYNYDLYQNDSIAVIETVMHGETEAENGLLGVDPLLYHHSFIDERGRLIWSRYTDGTLVRYEYDELTGLVSLIEYNADPGATVLQCTNCDYEGSFAGRNSEGGSTTVTYEYDLLGRLRQVSELTGETTDPARATRFTYEMRLHNDGYDDDRTGIAFLAMVSLPHAFIEDFEVTFVNPATVTLMNAHQKPIASARYLMTDGGTEDYGDIFGTAYEHSIDTESCVARSTVQHDLSGNVVSSTQWHSLAELGDNNGFYVTEYSYSARGHLKSVTAPNKSVTEYVRDALVSRL